MDAPTSNRQRAAHKIGVKMKQAAVAADIIQQQIGVMENALRECHQDLLSMRASLPMLGPLLPDTPVTALNLGKRASACLENANILTIAELVQRTPNTMLKYRNFGRNSLIEIQVALALRGHRLTEDP